ncbi:Cutl-17 [Aphelenchoides besseyi]|nr:Cutl-17 [Aphelenchoides besseyi]
MIDRLNFTMWPWILVFAVVVVEAQNDQFMSQCSETNKTTYLRTEGVLTNEMPILTLTDLTLNQCAQKCTDICVIGCHSFEYNAARQSCALKLANAQPFGRAILVPSSQPGIAFFQQICVPTENLCSAPYSFERFPQRVLTGHAMEVLTVDNLASCLRECLESKERMHLDCRSVMFYYELGQCVLNREQRKTTPHLFSADTKFQLVDYFENNCYDVNCPSNFNVHWVRMEDFEISAEKRCHNGRAEECKQACMENKVGTEVFPCKAYVYSSTKKECRLSAETGMVPVNGTKKANGSGISSELSSISAGQYYEKFCIEGAVKCKETSFDLIPNRILDARDKVIITPSLSSCLQQCLMMAEECNSAMFFKDRDECILNKKSQFSDPDLFHSAKKVDYFDNVCEYETRPPKLEVATEDDQQPQISKLKPMFKPEKQPLKSEVQTSTEEKKRDDPLDTECRLDGILVSAKFNSAASGAIFIKDHSSTCRQIFENSTTAKLEIPFPSSSDDNPKCPGVELSPSLWSFIIVLQKNEMGIPSLMTGTDRIFNVTCDYSNVPTNGLRENKKLEAVEDAPKIGFDMQSAPFPVSERVRMAILRDDVPVTTVSLGEELELRWTIDERAKRGPDDELLGFLVENCVAERMDGLDSPEPAPLPLIVGGCPEPKVRERLIRGPVVEIAEGFSTIIKVFRFDGSRRVRIRCSINICVERCEPINCERAEDPNSSSASFGRRKRRQTLQELTELVEQYDQLRTDGAIQKKLAQGAMIDQSTAQGSFTILDEPETVGHLKSEKSSGDHFEIADETVECGWSISFGCHYKLFADVRNGTVNQSKSHLCLRRSLAIGILIGFVVMGCSQMFWLVSWLQSRVLPAAVSSDNSTIPLESPRTNSRSSYLPHR